MNILDTLITDRTEDDVLRARQLDAKGLDGMTEAEKAEWRRGLKGAYSPSDMNRVVGAMEYIDHLMLDAKRDSVYVPTVIDHAEYNGTAWRRWSDKVWVDSDYATPELWTAHLENINRLWEAARRFEAAVLARYNPNGNGYIKPETVITPLDFCTVTDSVGLLELRITAVCPPSVTADGPFWTVTPTANGWISVMDYTNCPYPEIDNALKALEISCGADAIVDATFTLSAELRYDYVVTAGTCAVRWSPLLLWGEAREKYGTWGGTKPLTWGEAARGADT